MVYVRRTNKVYKKRTAYPKKYSKKTVKATKGLRKAIKSVIKSQTETKIAQPVDFNDIIPEWNPATPQVGEDITSGLLGNIGQGSGAGNRIGNQIKCKSCHFKAVFYCGTPDSPAPAYFRIILVRLKRRYGNDTVPTVAAPSGLLQNGNTSIQPANELFDMYQYINKDVYTVIYSRIMKLSPASGGTAPALAPNNDFKLSQMINVNLTKHIGTIRYDDANGEQNIAPIYLFALAAYADGSEFVFGGEEAAAPTLIWSGQTMMTYTDL